MPVISWEVESENDDIKTKILDSDSVKIRYLGDRKVNYTCTGKAREDSKVPKSLILGDRVKIWWLLPESSEDGRK